jgi:hypothetical protein
MSIQIDSLRWKPHWVSHLGCIKGCLDHLGLDISDAWLYGATGHAFIINMHQEVCPSGPTAWMTTMLFEQAKHIGYTIEGVMAWKTQDDFAAQQEEAWNFVKRALDANTPCYGWELSIPEFYVIHGYDDTGYYFSGPGCDAGGGPKPWREVGTSDIGLVEMYSVQRGEPQPDADVVKSAIDNVMKHAANSEGWILEHYQSGLAGFDTWIAALEAGTVDTDPGIFYNAAVWSECRSLAVAFLEEAKTRLGNGITAQIDAALEPYREVAANLNTVAETFPFFGQSPEHVKDPERVKTGLDALRAARSAEESGLAALQALGEAL